jgi:cytochrome c biogenesis protein ResB
MEAAAAWVLQRRESGVNVFVTKKGECNQIYKSIFSLALILICHGSWLPQLEVAVILITPVCNCIW